MTPARLSTREVALRTAAVAALTGIALVLAIELPWTLAQARHLGVLSALAIATCLGLATALTVARGATAPAPWRAVAALGGAVLAVWVATRAIAVPGLAATAGHWTTVPGLAACALAAGCLAIAAVGSGARPGRETARGVAAAVAIALALAPGAGALLAALGPGPAGGEQAIAGGGTAHVHVHAAGAQAAFRPGCGGHAGHYISPNARPPQLPSWAMALLVGGAVGFAYLAAGALARRRVDGGRRAAVRGGVPA